MVSVRGEKGEKMRLIDADELESGEVIIPTENGGYEYVEVFYKDDVDNAPTVDAVEVVRCKDCIHYWNRNGVCDAHIDLIDVDDDCYCSWGERKDETTDAKG